MLALCHTVVPVGNGGGSDGDSRNETCGSRKTIRDRAEMHYSAASPDEKALVEACRQGNKLGN